jgi:hypothetical protein
VDRCRGPDGREPTCQGASPGERRARLR